MEVEKKFAEECFFLSRESVHFHFDFNYNSNRIREFKTIGSSVVLLHIFFAFIFDFSKEKKKEKTFTKKLNDMLWFLLRLLSHSKICHDLRLHFRFRKIRLNKLFATISEYSRVRIIKSRFELNPNLLLNNWVTRIVFSLR